MVLAVAERRPVGYDSAPMTKLFSVLFLLLMIVQIVRPLGLPGLRRRSDFWKLAAFALVVFGVTTLIRP